MSDAITRLKELREKAARAADRIAAGMLDALEEEIALNALGEEER